MATKMGRVVIYLEMLLPRIVMALELQDHVTNSKRIHYHNAYDYQTWQGGVIQ